MEALAKNLKDWMGIIAGCLTTGAFIPQTFGVWSNIPKPAEDISLLTFSILTFGILLWVIYGVTIRSRPVIIFNAVTFVFSALVLVYKLIYG